LWIGWSPPGELEGAARGFDFEAALGLKPEAKQKLLRDNAVQLFQL
jgi:hypothetical protein